MQFALVTFGQQRAKTGAWSDAAATWNGAAEMLEKLASLGGLNPGSTGHAGIIHRSLAEAAMACMPPDVDAARALLAKGSNHFVNCTPPAIPFSHFFLALNGLGTFSAKGCPKVLWRGVGRGHPHLFQLHKRIADAALAAGLQPDLRPWLPHFTLARCRDVSPQSIAPFLRAHGDFDAGLVPIRSFQLKSSWPTPAGSIYSIEFSVAAAS